MRLRFPEDVVYEKTQTKRYVSLDAIFVGFLPIAWRIQKRFDLGQGVGIKAALRFCCSAS